MMQGYKTISLGLAMAILPEALKYLNLVDWTQYIPPQYAPIVTGLLMVAMRFMTTTPVGVKK
jgi:hypothetical protein